jgi:hypothetical protein
MSSSAREPRAARDLQAQDRRAARYHLLTAQLGDRVSLGFDLASLDCRSRDARGSSIKLRYRTAAAERTHEVATLELTGGRPWCRCGLCSRGGDLEGSRARGRRLLPQPLRSWLRLARIDAAARQDRRCASQTRRVTLGATLGPHSQPGGFCGGEAAAFIVACVIIQ